MLPWPSGDGVSLTWRRTQVRVLPGVLTAEWTGAWKPARSHKPSDAGSNPASATLLSAGGPVPGRASYAWRSGATPGSATLSWRGTRTGIAARSRAWCLWVRFPLRLLHDGLEVLPAAHRSGMAEDRVRLPAGPLDPWGRMYQGRARLPCKQPEMGSIPIVSTSSRRSLRWMSISWTAPSCS